MGDGHQFGRHRLAVEAGHAEDARLHADNGLGRRQRLDSGFAAVDHGADQVGRGFGFVGAFRHADNHGQRIALVLDGVQGIGERPVRARLVDAGVDVGDQDRTVLREGIGVGGRPGRDQTDDGGIDGADGARAFGDLGYADAVMVIGHGGLLL